LTLDAGAGGGDGAEAGDVWLAELNWRAASAWQDSLWKETTKRFR